MFIIYLWFLAGLWQHIFPYCNLRFNKTEATKIFQSTMINLDVVNLNTVLTFRMQFANLKVKRFFVINR